MNWLIASGDELAPNGLDDIRTRLCVLSAEVWVISFLVANLLCGILT